MKTHVTCAEFDPEAYCSRKLLEVLTSADGPLTRVAEGGIPISALVSELERRGHYLTELADRGLIRT